MLASVAHCMHVIVPVIMGRDLVNIHGPNFVFFSIHKKDNMHVCVLSYSGNFSNGANCAYRISSNKRPFPLEY